MLNRITNWLYQHQKFAAIEILQTGEDFSYHLLVLERIKKDEVKILSKNKGTDLSVLIQQLVKAQWPVFLNVEIKGILHKAISTVLEGNQALTAVLPNARAADFYVQTFPMSSGTAVSIIRQEVLDEWIKVFQKNNIWVLGCALGPFVIGNLASFIEGGLCITPTHRLTYNQNNELSQFEKDRTLDEGGLDLSGEYVEYNYLTTLALAYNGIDGNSAPLEIPKLSTVNQEYRNRQFFIKAGWSVLIVLMTALVVNTYFYFDYEKKNTALNFQFSNKKNILLQLDTLENRLGQFKQTSLSRQSMASFYSDRIAAILPSGIQLTSMQLFPLEGKVQDYMDKTAFQYQEDKILINGNSKSGTIYDNWLMKLEKLDFVEQAKHLDYKDLDNEIGAFELELTLALD